MTSKIHTSSMAQTERAASKRFTLPAPLRVTRIEQDNYRTKTLVLDGALDAYPGQFVMAWLPRFDEKPFSLVNADPVTLMVTAVGPMSRLLHELAVGDPLWIRGPFGHGFEPAPARRRLLFVGGGYGVAPLLWLARAGIKEAAAIDVVIGAATAQDLLYVRRFEQLAAAYAARDGLALSVYTTTEDGSAGVRGLVTDVVGPMLAQGQTDGIFACGPHGMLAALEALGAAHGVPCQLSWEAYMRCGMGICGSCDHQGKLLCLDGPVLSTPAATTT